MKNVALIAAALALFGVQAAGAASKEAGIGPKNKTFMPPGVKALSLEGAPGGKASPGSVVQISCAIGYVGDKKYDDNSPLAKTIELNNYSLPFEILVHNQVVHKSMLTGLDKPTTQYMKTHAWTVGQPLSGTTVSVECRIDPMNAVHTTSRKTFVTVIGVPQKELTTRQPSGERVMQNPNLLLPK